MSDVPSDLQYTAEHEWVRSAGGADTVRVGITDFAQQALGEVVYVSLPEVGSSVDGGAACGEVESTKSVSDLNAPLAGTITARNDALEQQPELINSDPYGDGWLIEIEPAADADRSALLDAGAYSALAK